MRKSWVEWRLGLLATLGIGAAAGCGGATSGSTAGSAGALSSGNGGGSVLARGDGAGGASGPVLEARKALARSSEPLSSLGSAAEIAHGLLPEALLQRARHEALADVCLPCAEALACPALQLAS